MADVTTSAREPFPRPLVPVLALLALSVFLNYVDRSNLSVAAPQLRDELRLSPSQLGMLLAAFFWTYAPFQLLSGWLVDRFDVKFVMATGFLLWSAATGVTALLYTFPALLAVRLLLGLSESVAYPSYSKIIATYIPEEHRGLANAVIASGLACGPAFGMFAGGMLVATVGWRTFFLALGVLSMAWLPPWARMMPRQRPAESSRRGGAPTLQQFLRQRSAWGMSFGQFTGNYLSYSLITWLPFYLLRERHFTVGAASVIAGGAYLAAAGCAITSGWASDRWIQAGGTPTLVRKTFMGVGTASGGLALFASTLVGSSAAVVALVMISVMAFSMASSNLFAISQRLAGTLAAGRWTGFQNFAGNLAGTIAPVVTGFLLDRTGHFAPAFAVSAVLGVLGAISFVFVVGPIEPVSWAKPSTATVPLRWSPGVVTTDPRPTLE